MKQPQNLQKHNPTTLTKKQKILKIFSIICIIVLTYCMLLDGGIMGPMAIFYLPLIIACTIPLFRDKKNSSQTNSITPNSSASATSTPQTIKLISQKQTNVLNFIIGSTSIIIPITTFFFLTCISYGIYTILFAPIIIWVTLLCYNFNKNIPQSFIKSGKRSKIIGLICGVAIGVFIDVALFNLITPTSSIKELVEDPVINIAFASTIITAIIINLITHQIVNKKFAK